MPVKISALPEAPGSLTGDELVPVVFDPEGTAVTVKVPLSDIGGGGGGGGDTITAVDGAVEATVSVSADEPTSTANFSVFVWDGTEQILINGSVIEGVASLSVQIGFETVLLLTGTKPVIPATPNAQDIADVLVALNLATQAP